MPTGTLYLIPTPLGEGPVSAVLPEDVRKRAASLRHFIAEHPKTARAFLKQLELTHPLQEIEMTVLDEHTSDDALEALLAPLLSGEDVGLVSEAGCPGVADPGANLVRLAHRRSISVVPMVGPSSIILALMSSGLNGQRFAFHGYLPADRAARAEKLKQVERDSELRDETQIFIETPYRNSQLFEAIVEICKPDTLVSVASNLTCENQMTLSRTVADWKSAIPDLQKNPTVFLIYRPSVRNSRIKSRRTS